MIRIKVNKIQITTTDPWVTVYELAVDTDKAEWRETFGSAELRDAFIRGVRAGASIGDHDLDVRVEEKDTL